MCFWAFSPTTRHIYIKLNIYHRAGLWAMSFWTFSPTMRHIHIKLNIYHRAWLWALSFWAFSPTTKHITEVSKQIHSSLQRAFCSTMHEFRIRKARLCHAEYLHPFILDWSHCLLFLSRTHVHHEAYHRSSCLYRRYKNCKKEIHKRMQWTAFFCLI